MCIKNKYKCVQNRTINMKSVKIKGFAGRIEENKGKNEIMRGF